MYHWQTLLLAVVIVGNARPSLSDQPAVPLPISLLRPGAEAGPTRVSYAVWFGDITRISSIEQTFTGSMLLVFQWQDPLLAHDGPGARQYGLEDIWHPRTLVFNATATPDESLPEVVDVAPDGTATYRQWMVGTFAQALNLHAFPFDSDIFRVEFVVPGHRPEEIEFSPADAATVAGLDEGTGIDANLTMQDWRVTSVRSRVEPFNVSPGIALAAFSIEFAADRRSGHFVFKIIIPLILIVAMSWAVFWIEPHDASTQVTVSLTAMLTLIAYQFVIDSDVPELPYLTRLDAFILMSAFLVFFSLIEVIVSTKFAYLDRTELARRIDRCCRWAFPLSFLGGTIITLGGWVGSV